MFRCFSVKITYGHDGICRLVIDNVLPGDSGCYKLVLSNKSGDVTTQCGVAITREYHLRDYPSP